MGKKTTVQSTKPSGLSITRSAGKFSCSWKLPSARYEKGVKFKYSIKSHKTGKKKKGKDQYAYTWTTPVSLGKNASSKSITIDLKTLYPFTYKKSGKVLKYPKTSHFSFKVQGLSKSTKKKNYTMSDWSGKTFTIRKPTTPLISVSRGAAYTSTVTMTPTYFKDSNSYITTQLVYKTRLMVKGANDKWTGSWSAETTKNITDASSWSKTLSESASNIQKIDNAKCAYRQFAVQARGPAGDSPWKYSDHIVYNGPLPAENVVAKVAYSTNKTTCTVAFDYKNYLNYRITLIKIEYAFASPEADLSAEEPDWQEAIIGGDNTILPSAIDKTGNPKAVHTQLSFVINQARPDNALLYVRVITSHNNRETISREALCMTDLTNGEVPYNKSVLQKPSINGITPVQTPNNRISVNLTNNCTASSSFIVVRFIPDAQTGMEPVDIGIVETNEYETEYDAVVEIPPDYGGEYRIGAYSVVGEYNLLAKIPEDYDTKVPPVLGYKTYSVSPKLQSDLETFGGVIPLPPSNVIATHLGEGNVMVTWDWKWTAAESAEVAWSDYSGALDSNEQPSSYIINNQKSGKLIVRNLELGKNWNFWVRLIKGENASIWSNIETVNLTSSPNIPSLNLSKENITIDETVTVSWAYVSTDNSPQGSAKICLCEIDQNGVISYDNIIAQIPNDEQQDPETQYIVLDPKSENLKWVPGNKYSLAIKVTSQSGLESEDWSEIATINVVEPISIGHMSTSLYPNVSVYNASSTYSAGNYVLRIVPETEDGKRNIALLYKAIVNISVPEEWNAEHWIIDDNQSNLLLKSLPLTVDIEDNNDALSTLLRIERSQDYFLDRPDEGVNNGYEGEVTYELENGSSITYQYDEISNPTVDNIATYYEYNESTGLYDLTIDTEIVSGKTYYSKSNYGIRHYEINQEDLFGYLDDGASYYLTYRISDEYDQYAELRYEFMVNWDHQAIDSEDFQYANVVIEKVVTEEDVYDVAKITINTPPAGMAMEGDCCDIYRISADGVVLLYENAQFGGTYVDPYPTIGEHGGHRVVYKTVYGDYIAADNSVAWIDFDDDSGDIVNSDGNIINYGDGFVKVMFNIDLSNNWSKDFQETHYLGGSIQGDWNAGISMSSTMSTNVMTNDWDSISRMRELAQYSGLCHVRTRDGMNYLADVQVSERIPYETYYDPEGNTTHIGEYSLTITRIDPIEPDGMTLKDWLDSISDEEIPPDN